MIRKALIGIVAMSFGLTGVAVQAASAETPAQAQAPKAPPTPTKTTTVDHTKLKKGMNKVKNRKPRQVRRHEKSAPRRAHK
jgi:hypothetical protein